MHQQDGAGQCWSPHDGSLAECQGRPWSTTHGRMDCSYHWAMPEWQQARGPAAAAAECHRRDWHARRDGDAPAALPVPVSLSGNDGPGPSFRLSGIRCQWPAAPNV